MADRPTIYFANFASHKTGGMHGPGALLSIMLWTPQWARPAGTVYLLTPSHEAEMLAELLRYRKAKQPVPPKLLADYRGALEARWAMYATSPRMFTPGHLRYAEPGCAENERPVEDGATLLCTCSVPDARKGECHRTFAAPFLVRAGWRVILDGVEVE